MQNSGSKLAVISLVFNIILAIAVIFLFVRTPAGSGETAFEPVDSTDLSKLNEKGQSSIVVYYNSDSLNTQSKLIMEIQTDILNSQVDAESRLKQKQDELMRWDKKWQEKGPLTSKEQEQYYLEGQKKQEELMQLQQTLEAELYEKQSRLTLIGYTRIQNYCRDMALSNGYDFVLSYQLGGQVSFANPKMDVTAELVERMNADYDSTFLSSEAAEAAVAQ